MANSAAVLASLLLAGLMGLLGQGVRTIVGLNSSGALAQSVPGQQSAFNAAYFFVTMMIGFIAGVLAGIGIGIEKLLTIDPSDIKPLLGIAVAGYAGTDFIENAFSRLVPGLGKARGAAATAPADASAVQTPTTHVTALADSLSALANNMRHAPAGPALAPAAPIAQLPAALGRVAPKVDTALWGPALTTAFRKFDMLTSRRIAAAVGQFLVEAGTGFERLAENLNYTHASRIAAVFPREFPAAADAEAFVGKPEALANRVYANRLGNGDEASGDGFRFRGRGLIQLTGRAEYAEFAAAVGMTAEQASAYCETPAGAAMSGCWYLDSRGCLPLADSWALSKITAKVNGPAMEGNDRRLASSEAMLTALGD